MRHNSERIGRFTSSQIYRLCGTEKVAMTYVDHKIRERRGRRSIEGYGRSRDMMWGKFMEIRINDLLGLKYDLSSRTTELHPKHGDIWSGSYDFIVPKVKVAELKAFAFLNFSKLNDVLMQKDIQLLKKEFPEIYWQVGSNAIINKVKNVEIISYMPYESEIPAIKKLAEEYDGDDFFEYKWIVDCDITELSCLPDGGYYSNITRLEFEFPVDDIIFLTAQVVKYGKILTAAKI